MDEPTTVSATGTPAGGEPRRWRLAGVAAALAIVLAVPLYLARRAVRGPREAAPAEALYVGSERCASCHRKEYDVWKGSHHGLAMQAARAGAVLGDFSGATFALRGKTWRFFRRDGTFMVSAEGPDGALHDYEVAYAFGVAPLQQYVIAFPGGRLQCLSVAWDTVNKRWFFLYPGQDIPPTDWLHWTRQAQNWNTMCADCHSTAVRKRYDPGTDTFKTTWSEIMVGCEACHGPGSRHAAWADLPAMARPPAEDHALVTRTAGLAGRELVALCAPCHSRRAQFADQGTPGGELLDRYLPVLLTEGVFYADGQILEEDYEYHSFIQSKMFANNVSCRDCHDVHSAARPKPGNETCTRCHRADTYDTEAHHFHKRTVNGVHSAGADCVSCHMPGRNYMVVHFRRDHSLRVPRPDLSAELGTPNACNAAGCHADKSVAWAVKAYDAWYGKKRKPHFGTILSAGRAGRREAAGALIELAGDQLRPAIARATAIELLGAYPGAEAATAIAGALGDSDPLVRHTAAAAVPAPDADRLVKLLAPLLSDPVRAVRDAAAARLAEVPVERLGEARRQTQTAALADDVKSQLYMYDMPSGPFNLGNLATLEGRPEEAEKHYRRALAIDDQFFLAKVNLALLLNRGGRNREAGELLEQVHAARPGDASVALDLGLLLAEEDDAAGAERALRAALASDPDLAAAAYNLAILLTQRDPAEALRFARRAAETEPEEPRYAYTVAFILHRRGESSAAITLLDGLLARHPEYVDAWTLLAGIYEESGEVERARDVCRRAAAAPGLPEDARAAFAARLAR
jgi:tetratricopeptide (TPR) repeat protein